MRALLYQIQSISLKNHDKWWIDYIYHLCKFWKKEFPKPTGKMNGCKTILGHLFSSLLPWGRSRGRCMVCSAPCLVNISGHISIYQWTWASCAFPSVLHGEPFNQNPGFTPDTITNIFAINDRCVWLNTIYIIEKIWEIIHSLIFIFCRNMKIFA